MAKQKSEKKAVALIAPNGSKVTVSEEAVGKFKSRGYKSPSARKSAAGNSGDDKAADKSADDSKAADKSADDSK